MAAVQCHLGESIERTTETSIKQARAHFTLAASQFTHIKDVLLTNINGSRTKDISPDVLAFLIQGCLANAQACYYEMSAISTKMSNKVRGSPDRARAFFYSHYLGFGGFPTLNLLRTHVHFVHAPGAGSPGHRHTRFLHASQTSRLSSRPRRQVGHSFRDASVLSLGRRALLAVQSEPRNRRKHWPELWHRGTCSYALPLVLN